MFKIKINTHRYYFIVGIGLMSLSGLLIISHFGWTWHALAALLLTGMLIALGLIDWKIQCLPDGLTLSLLWLGLLLNISSCFVSLEEAVMGAALGYILMSLLAQGFYFCTGKIGLGQGDWKLFAALGAWFGWQPLPEILAAASLTGLIVFFLMVIMGKCNKSDPIPFGPFLSLSGWFMLWVA